MEQDMRRLEELAVSRLFEPLSTDEAEEYAALKRRFPNFDEAAIERLVALAHLAVLPEAKVMPRTLRAVIEKDAEEFFGAHRPLSAVPPAAQASRETASRVSSAGWWVALAASLVTVVVLLHRAPAVPAPPVASTAPSRAPEEIEPITPVPPAPPPSVDDKPATAGDTSSDLASERRAFLASHPRVIERAWRAGGDPTGERVTGDVVWDSASQTGYMRFVNLPRNEPNAEQYQLWIFDGERDQRYPVDGGVFDVGKGRGEQIIRIHANLPVRLPLVFAVTVEHPGGVVVSDRSRLAVIADVT
jgi:hypothetical protein